MKHQGRYEYNKKETECGFTLLEVLISIAILSIGLLGMAALTVGTIKGNELSNDLTTATTLAQDQMEDLRRQGYSGIPAADTTTTEDYNSISGYADYKRVTQTEIGVPAVGMKTVTVTTSWQGGVGKKSVELKTIFTQ